MKELQSYELDWPQVCVGCGNPADSSQEELIDTKEGIRICSRCDAIARMEQLSGKGWKLVFGLISFILVLEMTLIPVGNLLLSTLVGLIAIIPPLFFDGVFSQIYSYDRYVGQKAIDTFQFRNRTYLNLFAALNPSIEASPAESIPKRKVTVSKIISTFIVFILSVIISLMLFAIPDGEIIVEYHLQTLLRSPWYIGSALYFLLTRISRNIIPSVYPDSDVIPEITRISPTLQPGRIISAAQWELESNIAIHDGQKTIFERAEAAIEHHDYSDAIRLYKKSIDMNPSDLNAWLGISLAFAKAGRCIESRDAIHRAQDIASDPNAVQKELDECEKICKIDFSREAPAIPIIDPPVIQVTNDEASFRKLIDEDPMNPKSWAGLAAALAKSGRCYDAHDALQRAKDIDSNEPEIWYVLDECRKHCETIFKIFKKEDEQK
ncbi:MAG: tetratricopeptide repeat protein [Candidatus Thorarchaeota archaeon]